MSVIKSNQKRISAFIVSLIMLFIMTSAGQTRAAGHLDVTIGHNCELNGTMGVEYTAKINTTDAFDSVFLCLERQVFSDASANYTWETINLQPSDYRDGQYYFYYSGLSAMDMGSIMHATVIATKNNNRYISDVDVFSIKSYCMELLNLYGGSVDPSAGLLRTLLVDMLNLGAAMQNYNQINTGDLPNKDLTSAQKAFGSALYTNFSSCASVSPLNGASATLDHYELMAGKALCLAAFWKFTSAPASDVNLELNYTAVDGTAVNAKINKSDFVYDSASGLYMVPLSDIASPDFQTAFTIQMKKGTTAISALHTYSGESYLTEIAQYASGSLWNVIQNIMTFCNSAKNYFAAVGGQGPDPYQPSGEISTYKNSPYTMDMPQAVIVIPSSATAEEQYAADLIQKYISREDGYTPSIVRDSMTQGSRGFEISVGNTNRPHGTMRYSSYGAYKIKSYTNGISIKGIGKRGTIDGAMKFLSICGGYFWLSFEDGYKTNQTHFKYSTSIDLDHKRAFLFTDIDIGFGITHKGDNRMYSLAYGLNGFYVNCTVSDKPGGQKWYLSKAKPGAYGGLQPGQAHTLLAEYIPADEYFATHPEYYAMWKGSRNEEQLCLSNPDVYDRIKEHVFEILESDQYDPNAEMQIICLAEADNEKYCECSTCFKKRMEYEAAGAKVGLCEAGLLLDICNRISTEVKAAGYKNVYIDMLAYTYTRKPPVNITIDDHVIVRYAPEVRCYAHNCDDVDHCDRTKEYYNHIMGWVDLCNSGHANLWIWDYNANFRFTVGPYLNIDTMCHDIKFYYDHGITGVYLQSNDMHSSCNTEYGDLRNYILAVLLENPNADVEKEIEFFMNEFYGASGPYILEGMRILEEQAKNHYAGPNCVGRAYDYRDQCYMYKSYPSTVFANNYRSGMDAHNTMPMDQVLRVEELWNLALQAADNDTETHRYRTYRTNVSWRVVKSTMKVLEFADSSTYAQKNQELYNDIFDTYGTYCLSLYTRKDRSKYTPNLSAIPERWEG